MTERPVAAGCCGGRSSRILCEVQAGEDRRGDGRDDGDNRKRDACRSRAGHEETSLQWLGARACRGLGGDALSGEVGDRALRTAQLAAARRIDTWDSTSSPPESRTAPRSWPC